MEELILAVLVSVVDGASDLQGLGLPGAAILPQLAELFLPVLELVVELFVVAVRKLVSQSG